MEEEVKKLWREINTGHEYAVLDSYNILYGICLDIANWQKEQMMANAADMVVGYWMPNGLMLTVDETENSYNIDEGDKVKVILIKED